MTRCITALFGVALVMYVANGISISADKGNVWPAVVIGTMCTGGGLALLLMRILDRRQ